MTIEAFESLLNIELNVGDGERRGGRSGEGGCREGKYPSGSEAFKPTEFRFLADFPNYTRFGQPFNFPF